MNKSHLIHIRFNVCKDNDLVGAEPNNCSGLFEKDQIIIIDLTCLSNFMHSDSWFSCCGDGQDRGGDGKCHCCGCGWS